MPRIAWDNAAHSLLERTLDDSANRRTLLPEAFLIADELLRTSSRLINGLVVHEGVLKRNLELYGPFAAIERVLMALCKAGADRQVMHECLRQHSMTAWAAVQTEAVNPLVDLLTCDSELLVYLPKEEIDRLMDANAHVGDAPQRAQALSAMVRATFE
jgi:adenylosuccinate lyase